MAYKGSEACLLDKPLESPEKMRSEFLTSSSERWKIETGFIDFTKLTSILESIIFEGTDSC